MSKTTPIPEGRVKHLTECAEIAHRHGHTVAASRFAGIALDILNTARVRNAGAWRQRLLDLGDTA